MKFTTHTFTVLAVVNLLTACGSDSDYEEEMAGTCDIVFREPVIHLDAAYGQQSGAVIGDIVMTDLTVNDRALNEFNVGFLADDGVNVSAEGNTLYCTLPCQFGVEEGIWTFTVTADGYLPTGQNLEAAYGSFDGGCPAYYDEGSHFELRLNEEGL